MNTYRITYVNGETEDVHGAHVEWEYDARLFVIRDTNGGSVLITPMTTVHSIRRTAAA